MKNKNIYVIYATKEIFAKRKGRKKDNADSINPPRPPRPKVMEINCVNYLLLSALIKRDKGRH